MNDHISHLYGLPSLSYDEKVQKGYLSENHIFTDETKKYFLKQYRYTDPEKVRFIHDVGGYFASKDIPAILPLRTVEGNDFFEYEGRLYTLFPFVDAYMHEYNSPKSLSREMIISLSTMLAKIHKAGESAPFSKEHTYSDKGKMRELASAVLDMIAQKEEKTAFDVMAQELLELKLSLIENHTDVDLESLPADHLVHGDFTEHNVFFDEKGEVSHVFDFEKAQYQHRSQELFRSLFLIFIDFKNTEKEYADAKLYLDTYQAHYPMFKEELSLGYDMYYQKMIHGMWIEKEHYLLKNSKIDPLLVRDHARLHFMAAHKDSFKAFLLV